MLITVVVDMGMVDMVIMVVMDIVDIVLTIAVVMGMVITVKIKIDISFLTIKINIILATIIDQIVRDIRVMVVVEMVVVKAVSVRRVAPSRPYLPFIVSLLVAS